MSEDISAALAGWDFHADDLQVRMIVGDDGRERIQMRIDLGVLQMECEGRPDGQRPDGFDSFLDQYEARRNETETAGDEFSLEPDACSILMREGLQYYHRYLSAFHLQLYDMVARDTERNLRLFAFVARYASRRRDKIQFDQYRPYVAMMRSRALALKELARNDHAAALEKIDDGVRLIREFLEEYHQGDREADCSELSFLLRWRRDVQHDRPTGPLERLEEQLELAVALEIYEEAARLRDQIRKLKGAEAPEAPGLGMTATQPGSIIQDQ
ncbi:UvrB/UvrC motif-containing protein [Paludisphaera borealis]|uniref:UVR domain-containing protein n=1 Tax=Paludisphaera borealis TaxID=1387353 RepID=A0A1U7CM88_9BACT|nr:UvrB/UvrC motif-containing protein [Paludisphaera borealis]APW60064.1 hypothetical protein BSF38_01526 [Paludisphaera borealis]